MKNRIIKNYTNNKVIGSILTICILILLIGFSYAFFVYNKTGLYTHTITGGKMSIIYNETTGNNITIDNAYPLTDEEALTKGLEFEFAITGYNESDKNIYYAIEMDYGEDVENKERFKDSDLKLSLYENEEKIFENEVFDNLDNQNIHYGMINSGTSSESPVTNNYKLRLWINDYVIISDTISDDIDTWTDFEWDWLWENCNEVYMQMENDWYSDIYINSLSHYGVSIYTTEEFQNMYVNFKVNVKADLNVENSGYIYYDANGGYNTPTKTSVLDGKITLQKPLMDGKGFLGWSSTPDGDVEYKSGEYYTGKGQMLYAVYNDNVNKMQNFSNDSLFRELAGSITKIMFINDIQENIDNNYNNAIYKWDLSYDENSNVKSWLEFVANDDILYIAAEGTIYLTDCYDMFYLSSLEEISFDNADTCMLINMSHMFFNCESLVNLDLSGFSTSNVTNMSGMFEGCGNLSELDVSNFDTSSVTNMSQMFVGCESLVNLDLSGFSTSNVTNMSGMFWGCRNLSELDLSNFDTSDVTDMSGMFWGCRNLSELDLSYFDINNVTDMSFMFSDCSELTSIYSNSDWNTGNVTSVGDMFFGCTSLVGAVPYDYTKTDITMANPDTGYFTRKTV